MLRFGIGAIFAMTMFTAQALPVAASTVSVATQPAGTTAQRIRVAGYDFEPFVEEDLGLTPALLTLMNGHQNDFYFVFVKIPAQRRYELMQRGAIEAIFFEMERWGWNQETPSVEVTKPVMKIAETFFAMKNNARGDAIFSHLKESKLAVTLGYHYAFADFNADQNYIRSQFDVVFATSQRVALRYLVSGNAHMAIMSDAFLNREFVRNASLKGKIIRAPRDDQTYELPLMVRKNGPLSIEALEAILHRLVDCECLEAFFKAYGVGEQLVFQR